jgi:hypothetical protein
MSFKLFFASNFGLIKPTAKIEAEQEALLKDYQLFCSFIESAELKEYQSLNQYVNSESFKNNRKKLEQLRFKGSQEEKLLKELHKLERNSKLQKCLQTEKSENLKKFKQVAASDNLKRYEELKKWMDSGAFQAKKKKLAAEVYHGSPEEKAWNEYQQLKNDKKLAAHSSDKPTPNPEIAAKMIRLADLEKLVNSKEFQERKKYLEDPRKFEKTDTFAKHQEYEKLKNSEEIRFYFQYAKSPDYQNYLRMKDSPERKRFDELGKIVHSPEFAKQKAYLEDTKRWEKTEDAAKAKRLEELKKLPELINYLKYEKSNAFDFLKSWDLVFEDRFISARPDHEKWTPMSYWASQTVGSNFSQEGDLQTFSDGKNLKTGGSLKIEVRKEKSKGLQWKYPYGFLEQEFDYTSGIVSTGSSNWWKNGILEAKVKYSPEKSIADVIYLIGKENSPQINLLEMGPRNQVGLLVKNGDQVQVFSESLSGLKTGEFYIFTLEWAENKLTWKINGRDLLTVTQQVPHIDMHLNASSIVAFEPNGCIPHTFEIAWVRFYQKKK